ncbi:hypothetical protein D3C76_1461820 [compost metagenome]
MHGADQQRTIRIELNGLAQLGDMLIQRAAVRQEIIAPGSIEQHLARDDLILVLIEALQDFHLAQ